MDTAAREAFEPASWLLVFNHHASTRWRSFLAFGRFKHVWAVAYIPTVDAWLVYDVHLDGTMMGLVPDGEPFKAFFGRQTQNMGNATLISMPRQPPRKCRSISRYLGFWCVPAIKHLIGLRCGALRPDAFYRHCLRNGGTPFEAPDADARVPAIAA